MTNDLKLSGKQYEAIKSLTAMAERFADEVLKFMQRTGLDKIPGCDLSVEVDPAYECITKKIEFGKDNDESEVGKFEMVRGLEDEKYELDTDSKEYEILFADEATKERIRTILNTEKPLPPNGLWISAYDDPASMDGGQ